MSSGAWLSLLLLAVSAPAVLGYLGNRCQGVSSAHEKWGQKQKCCIYNFVQCRLNIYICYGYQHIEEMRPLLKYTNIDINISLSEAEMKGIIRGAGRRTQ